MIPRLHANEAVTQNAHKAVNRPLALVKLFRSPHHDVLGFPKVGKKDPRLAKGVDEDLNNRRVVSSKLVAHPEAHSQISSHFSRISPYLLRGMFVVWDSRDWFGKHHPFQEWEKDGCGGTNYCGYHQEWWQLTASNHNAIGDGSVHLGQWRLYSPYQNRDVEREKKSDNLFQTSL